MTLYDHRRPISPTQVRIPSYGVFGTWPRPFSAAIPLRGPLQPSDDESPSDAAALGVGRYLSTAAIEVRGETAFIASEAAAREVAKGYVEANRSFAPSGGDHDYTLQFGTDDGSYGPT